MISSGLLWQPLQESMTDFGEGGVQETGLQTHPCELLILDVLVILCKQGTCKFFYEIEVSFPHEKQLCRREDEGEC